MREWGLTTVRTRATAARAHAQQMQRIQATTLSLCSPQRRGTVTRPCGAMQLECYSLLIAVACNAHTCNTLLLLFLRLRACVFTLLYYFASSALTFFLFTFFKQVFGVGVAPVRLQGSNERACCVVLTFVCICCALAGSRIHIALHAPRIAVVSGGCTSSLYSTASLTFFPIARCTDAPSCFIVFVFFFVEHPATDVHAQHILATAAAGKHHIHTHTHPCAYQKAGINYDAQSIDCSTFFFFKY